MVIENSLREGSQKTIVLHDDIEVYHEGGEDGEREIASGMRWRVGVEMKKALRGERDGRGGGRKGGRRESHYIRYRRKKPYLLPTTTTRMEK